MSNNKQSSVEWVIYQLGRIQMLFKFGEIGVQKYNRLDEEITEKAKAMHKEEIEKAFKKGVKIGVDVGSNHDYHEGYNAEQYYNETFGGNNENN